VLRFRRTESRKVAQLARLLAALDEQARTARPAPRRTSRVVLGGR
jgi:hypothetical protein